MPPEQQTPLVLTAMTLRGIGSYMRGARLEVCPLTVLCGTNGSGKSTWLKVLNLLRRSVDANTLPWSFHVADRTVDSIQVTNAFYYLGFGGSANVHSLLADPEADREFGPPGTIGLEFRASCDIQLDSTEHGRHDRFSRAQRLFWSGECPAGTAMKLRIAHPAFVDDSAPTRELRDWVELEFDDGFVVRMWGDTETPKDSPSPQRRPQRSKPYEVSCSEGFLPGRDPCRTDVVALATVTDLQILRCNSRRSDVSRGLAKAFVGQLERRIRQLLRQLLDGYFYIGAIREPHTYLSVERLKVREKEKLSVLTRRHVGAGGEFAWLLERHYARARK